PPDVAADGDVLVLRLGILVLFFVVSHVPGARRRTDREANGCALGSAVCAGLLQKYRGRDSERPSGPPLRFEDCALWPGDREPGRFVVVDFWTCLRKGPDADRAPLFDRLRRPGPDAAGGVVAMPGPRAGACRRAHGHNELGRTGRRIRVYGVVRLPGEDYRR